MKRFGLYALIGLLVLSNLFFVLKKPTVTAPSAAQRSEKYPLLARRIFIDNPNDTLLNFSPVRKIVEEKFTNSTIPHSVYFEYIPTGVTVREHGETQLIAASLVKLPLVMNLFHAAEKGEVDLDKKIQLTDNDLDSGYGDLYQKGAGYSLTLREAAKIALTQSDNTAARAINRLTTGLLPSKEEALYALDIGYALQGNEAVYNARSYTSILSCLYFSCYLNVDSSQEILTYLTENTFKDRLTATTPSSIKVAHKFGTYDDTKTYSDCGIFYVPKRPYVLCIMMQGDEKTINGIMADTSEQVLNTVLSM